MCGIAGIISFHKNSSFDCSDNETDMKNMLNVMRHRGPDNTSVKDYGNIILGHNRLSIIDTSPNAHQPMDYGCGKFALVFNGELYNYVEIKQKLEGRGYFFSTSSDTEVMLKAFIEWGEDAVHEFNGMFAGCYVDKQQRRIILFRDRFGQKPIYFHHMRDSRFCFASEIKAILYCMEDIKPNEFAWKKYLATASYDEDNETMFEGVFQIMPGELHCISENGKIEIKKWYDLTEKLSVQRKSFLENSNVVRELIDETTNIHMRADVDIGVCLSGGLDSSILLSSIMQNTLSENKPRCFSVEFENELSERKWINATAEHFDLNAQIQAFSERNFLETLRPVMWHSEGPLGGLMNCAMALVFEDAKSAGVKVLQDGTGLDEAFGGYQYHHNLYLAGLRRSEPAKYNSALGEYCINWSVSTDMAEKKIEAAASGRSMSIDGTVPYNHEVLSFNGDEYLTNSRNSEYVLNQTVQSSLIDFIQTSKIPRNTRMKDRMSMAYSTELRLPFLDHRLVEFGISLNAEQMFKNGRSKSVLRNGFTCRLPQLVNLAPKRSIQAPQGKWLSNNLMREYIFDLLDSQTIRNTGFFHIKKCKAMFERHLEKNYENSFFIWQWINVFEWFTVFKEDNPLKMRYELSNLNLKK